MSVELSWVVSIVTYVSAMPYVMVQQSFVFTKYSGNGHEQLRVCLSFSRELEIFSKKLLTWTLGHHLSN